MQAMIRRLQQQLRSLRASNLRKQIAELAMERDAHRRVRKSRADAAVYHSRAVQQTPDDFALDRDSVAMHARDLHSQELVKWYVAQDPAGLADAQFALVH